MTHYTTEKSHQHYKPKKSGAMTKKEGFQLHIAMHFFMIACDTSHFWAMNMSVEYGAWEAVRLFRLGVRPCTNRAQGKEKGVAISRNSLIFKALQDGLEPTTPWLTVRCSNQLSYWSSVINIPPNADAKVESFLITCKFFLVFFASKAKKNKKECEMRLFHIIIMYLCMYVFYLLFEQYY